MSDPISCDKEHPAEAASGDDGFSLRWNPPTQAHLVATREIVVCLRGRGRIRNASSQSRIIDVHGYELRPSDDGNRNWTDFCSAPWSSWITLSLSPGDALQIDSSTNDGGSAANPSFEIVPATRRDVRPTIVPDSWRTAVQSIVEDFSALLAMEQQRKNSYGHASFFQDFVRDAMGSEDTVDGKGNFGYQIVFCGAKSVGKSTCLRYCLNRLLSTNTAVAVLDADPGQPEYTLPGMMQLTFVSQPNLQPPHVHVTRLHCHEENADTAFRVLQRYYFGSITTASDPVTYLRHVASLVQQYQELCPDLPLIINLDGWIKDLGFSILTTLLQETLQPRHVVQISGDSLSKVLDLSSVVLSATILHRCWAYQLSERPLGLATNVTETSGGNVPPSERPPFKRSASSVLSEGDLSVADPQPMEESEKGVVSSITPTTSFIPASVLRDIRLIAYFMVTAETNTDSNHRADSDLWDTIRVSSQGLDDSNYRIGNALAAARPFVVALDALDVRFTQSEWSRDIRSKDRLLDALNGSLVGLCQRQEEEVMDDAGKTPSLLPCVGLGLVRSVDSARRLLFLLTPVKLATLQSVNCLLLGTNVHLPVHCYFRGIHAEAFPYLSFQEKNEMADILGSDPMRSRNNINRRGRINGGS
jgi:polynucleotide 5'-hydroxyl-kinase GRC3/NOL9